jgi:alkanesulfonate monooxygenase SsuD/methylene tetrahydromethanopterin reductase-like flavin-dependent oxidoreductase (luciferase family)
MTDEQKKTIEKLKDSEREAAKEYADAIKSFGDDPEVKAAVERFAEIKDDEEEHLRELQAFVPDEDDKKKVKDSPDQWFYGIVGIKFIYHGDWNDPEVEYKGRRYDYYDLEDALWDEYKEDTDTDIGDEDQFKEWLSHNQDEAFALLDSMDPIKEDDSDDEK